MTVWDQLMHDLRVRMPDEDFRRWFGATAYASDSGDQITVWVASEAIRRHIVNHYSDVVQRALIAIAALAGRRLVICGIVQDERYFAERVEPHIDGERVVFRGSVGPRRFAAMPGSRMLPHCRQRHAR